jgi:hypothetical protein
MIIMDNHNNLGSILDRKSSAEMDSILKNITKRTSSKYNFPIESINDLNEYIIEHKELMDLYIELQQNASTMNNNKHTMIFMLSKEHPIELKYQDIEIRRSNIHGNGLFATNDIPANVIVTFYPAHGIKEGNTAYLDNSNESFKRNITLYATTHGFNISSNDVNETVVESLNDISLMNSTLIIGDPNNTKNRLLLGHMLNDVGGNIFQFSNIAKKIKIPSELKCLIRQYSAEGSKKNNCKFVVDHHKVVVSIVTTKEIKKNDELLVSYGPIYWLYKLIH